MSEFKCELLADISVVDGFTCLMFVQVTGDDVEIHRIVNINGIHADQSSTYTVDSDFDIDVAIKELWFDATNKKEQEFKEVIKTITSILSDAQN